MGKKTGKSGSGTKSEGSGKKKWSTKNVLHSPFAPVFPPALAGSTEAVCQILGDAFPNAPLKRPPQPPPHSDSDTSGESSCSTEQAARKPRSRAGRDEMSLNRAAKHTSGVHAQLSSEAGADTLEPPADKPDELLSRRITHQCVDSMDIDVSDSCRKEGSASRAAIKHEGEQRVCSQGKVSKTSKELSMSVETGDPALDEMGTDSARKPAVVTPARTQRPRGLLCGVNEVTKGLERGTVSLVVVARDVSPSVLTAHLPVLCFMKGASLVPISGNGEDMAKVMGIKRLIALGICLETNGESIDDMSHVERLYSQLRRHECMLDFPWLSAAKGGRHALTLPEPVLAPPNKLRT